MPTPFTLPPPSALCARARINTYTHTHAHTRAHSKAQAELPFSSRPASGVGSCQPAGRGRGEEEEVGLHSD